MPSILGRAILETLTYSDVFDYPLQEEEIWRWLIECNNVTIQQCNNEIHRIKKIQKRVGYYFLIGRREIVDMRKKRQKSSKTKVKIAKKVANLLKIIPTIKLIGITGALAVSNSEKDDDIDLFIITSKDLVWTTRFITTVLIELTGKRRHPGQVNVSDKICLNMFVDENHLSISKEERDLFSAHEVIQMKKILDRDNTYQKFIKANLWIEKYLPNAFDNLEFRSKNLERNKKIKFLVHSPWFLVRLFEEISKRFQLWYMRKRRTKEVIREGIIRFHPQDAREWVMERYNNKLLELKLK